jgi:hypothetical protein
VAGGTARAQQPGEWVLLHYRIPREPSTPRITLWRRLRRLGIVQLGDGLVALPADARTREQLEWLAEEVLDAGGTAGVWLARPASLAQERALAAEMASARAAEYDEVTEAARALLGTAVEERARAAVRLRKRWREITRRDFFPPTQRDIAAAALHALTATETPNARTAGTVEPS